MKKIKDYLKSIILIIKHYYIIEHIFRSMASDLIPMKDPDVIVLIINSNVQHSLASGEYGTRRRQCQQAAELLSVKSLRFASLDQLEGMYN